MTGKVKDRKLVKGESVNQFFEAIRSPYTRASYERRLITFLTTIHMPVDQFVEEARAKPEWAQKVVLEYLLRQKERFQNKEIQASSIKSVLKPLLVARVERHSKIATGFNNESYNSRSAVWYERIPCLST